MKSRILLNLILPLTISASLLSCASPETDCNDGADNDGDNLIDSADPGCILTGKWEAPDPITKECEDGNDNDGDSLVDFEDPGCAHNGIEFEDAVPQCQDGIDNDGDSLLDFPNDPGCLFALGNSEEDSCPASADCPKCGNGIDDDGDTLIDYPNDPGCNSASDSNEFNGDPETCGTEIAIQPLPDDGVIINEFLGERPGGLISGNCGGAGEERVYTLTLAVPKSLHITTDFSDTTIDTIIYLRSTCTEATTEFGCNDDEGLNVSTMDVGRLEPGTYFIVVDTPNSKTQGPYHLEVTSFTPEKEVCDIDNSDCFAGLTCRNFVKGGVMADIPTCEKPECSDGEDSDGDGLVDFPDEPGCESPSDLDEADGCQDNGECPACSNGIDDDGDTLIDFGSDLGCNSAFDDLELDECISGVPLIPLHDAGTTATTPADAGRFKPSCDSFGSKSENVHVYKTNQNLASLTFTAHDENDSTVLSVRGNECSSAAEELACDDPFSGDSSVTIDTPAINVPYYVFLDGDSENAMTYTLNVSGRILADNACIPGGTQFTCIDGYTCGSESTCVPTQCNDTLNNDMDSLSDYPADPGCTDINDNDETDNCPTGADCPQCSNGIDDDEDTFIDYPMDIGCDAASDNVEADDCIPGVPLRSLDDSGATGTTEPSGNSDFHGSCSLSSSASEDEFSYRNTHVLNNLTFSTVGSAQSSVLYIRHGECGSQAAEIACLREPDNGQTITIPMPVQNSIYYVFVDGHFASELDYVLNVSGTIDEGDTCATDDTQFICDPVKGLICGAANTCQLAQCNDGITNDEDDLVDSFDPGCESLVDNNEADDPASVPQCLDGIDNDSDGQSDFPNDLGCERASDNEEKSCRDTDPIISIIAQTTTGTTSGGTNDFIPSCRRTSVASDVAARLEFPGDLESLVVDTNTSEFDTVLYIRRNVCHSEDFSCDDDLGEGSRSLIELTNVEAGIYFFIVDGFSTSATGNYVLHVQGVIKSGQACNQEQITAGVLSCATGTTCTSGLCQ